MRTASSPLVITRPGPLRRHPGLGAAGRVQRERLRQIQLGVDQRLSRAGHVGGVHRHLAVLHLPGHARCTGGPLPTVWRPFLMSPVSSNTSTPSGAPRRLDHIAAQVLAHPVLVPHRLVQQPLHPVRRALARGLSHRPPVAGRQRREQPLHVRQRPLPRLRPEEPRPDQLTERVQLPRPLLHQSQVRFSQSVQLIDRHHTHHDLTTTTSTTPSRGQDQLKARL